MADYAMQLFTKIEEVNEHSFNNFRMRIGKWKFFFFLVWRCEKSCSNESFCLFLLYIQGINVGPVVAGRIVLICWT